MTQAEKNTSSSLDKATKNSVPFSAETNTAVNNIVSFAEAQERYGKINKSSQSAAAFVRHLLGSIGIDIGGDIASDATELVRLRALAATNPKLGTDAANDSTFHQEEPKKAA